MNSPQLSALAIVLSAAASSVPQDGSAQSLNDEAIIAIEATWTGGYMGLGGGLQKAIAIRTVAKTVSSHRSHHSEANRAPMPPRREAAPVTLISQTLDHTGLNISSIGAAR